MYIAQAIYALDLFGVAVFAVSGSLVAGRKRMDIFGVLVLALVTALGGGTLRDLLLDSGPIFWIDNLSYVLVVVAISILTFIAVRLLPVPRLVLLISDALGLAVFTMIGTAKALDATNSGIVAIIMGVMTGIAGGIIRDVLSAEVPLVLRKEIYATASLCGSLVYVLMSHLNLSSVATIVLSIITTLSIRLAAIRWGLSLPLFMSKHDNVGIKPEDEDDI